MTRLFCSKNRLSSQNQIIQANRKQLLLPRIVKKGIIQELCFHINCKPSQGPSELSLGTGSRTRRTSFVP